jgi:hypothetical protein
MDDYRIIGGEMLLKPRKQIGVIPERPSSASQCMNGKGVASKKK